jgi:hypothetical protein
MSTRSGWTRTAGRNVTATEAVRPAASALGKHGLTNEQQYDERAKNCSHVSSVSHDGKGSATHFAIGNLKSR